MVVVSEAFWRIYKMGKNTVKRRIFISNALMVMATLFLFLIINAIIVKVYLESIEHEFKALIEKTANVDKIDKIIDDFTIRRNGFILLFLLDGLLCIAVLVVISQLFTGNLVKHIMKPLAALSEGVQRIKKNDLTREISYSGDIEFENVCNAFNDMQKHILIEREKNHKYEKARADMIAGISHDLRTPLTAVRGMIKGLLDGVATTKERQNRFLQTAYRRTEDMDVLLNQLFYLSKLETGNMPLNLKEIELSWFIESYVTGKQALLENEQIEIGADTKGAAGKTLVDLEQLQRIFDNLLENSRKYAETVPLKIRIRLERTKESFCIRFSDNGAGVPEEKLPYLFEEFYRGDESRNQKEGNGLGLYIVKYLIEAMGGSVYAKNKDGFTVFIELPVVDKKAIW